MRDFEGLENCDVAIKSAVINFSFSLSIGDIDQAFKAIRNVNRYFDNLIYDNLMFTAYTKIYFFIMRANFFFMIKKETYSVFFTFPL